MTLSAATIEDMPAIAEAMAEIGMPIDIGAVKRYFFTGDLGETNDGLRGGLVARDDGQRVVGYCGLTPCTIYVDGKSHEAYEMGILGVRQGYGVVMIDFMDKVVELTTRSLVFANTANEKSVKLWTQYAGFHSGPELGDSIQYAFLPLGLLTVPKFTRQIDFKAHSFQQFWDEYKSGQQGIVVDRSSKRFERLFGPGIRQGRLSVITHDEDGRMVGYAVLRTRPLRRLRRLRYEIIDIIALGDNDQRIRMLIKKCKHFAGIHGGVLLEYVGGQHLLPHRRPALANTFIWSGGDSELKAMLAAGKGWFFGPYDGDRAMT